jgi:DNA-binding transcriptional ArsR family regulator
VTAQIEEVFSSKGRVRILRVLAEIGELNISEISRRSGLNYSTTNRHLQILESAGLVKQRRYGRIRIYRFNENDSRVRIIKELVYSWEK